MRRALRPRRSACLDETLLVSMSEKLSAWSCSRAAGCRVRRAKCYPIGSSRQADNFAQTGTSRGQVRSAADANGEVPDPSDDLGLEATHFGSVALHAELIGRQPCRPFDEAPVAANIRIPELGRD